MYESCYIAFFMFLMSVSTTFIDWGIFHSFTSVLTCHLASPVFAFVLFCVFVQLTVSLATFLFQSVWSQWRRGNGLSVSPEHDVADRKWHHRSAWFVVYCQRRDFWTGKSAGPWLQVIFFRDRGAVFKRSHQRHTKYLRRDIVFLALAQECCKVCLISQLVEHCTYDCTVSQGHGLESQSSLKFFQAYFLQLLKLCT